MLSGRAAHRYFKGDRHPRGDRFSMGAVMRMRRASRCYAQIPPGVHTFDASWGKGYTAVAFAPMAELEGSGGSVLRASRDWTKSAIAHGRSGIGCRLTPSVPRDNFTAWKVKCSKAIWT